MTDDLLLPWEDGKSRKRKSSSIKRGSSSTRRKGGGGDDGSTGHKDDGRNDDVFPFSWDSCVVRVSDAELFALREVSNDDDDDDGKDPPTRTSQSFIPPRTPHLSTHPLTSLVLFGCCCVVLFILLIISVL